MIQQLKQILSDKYSFHFLGYWWAVDPYSYFADPDPA